MWRGRDFDEFLIAPLDGAFAVAKMRDTARAIAQDLDFDVPGARHKGLNIEIAASESGGRL